MAVRKDIEVKGDDVGEVLHVIAVAGRVSFDLCEGNVVWIEGEEFQI